MEKTKDTVSVRLDHEHKEGLDQLGERVKRDRSFLVVAGRGKFPQPVHRAGRAAGRIPDGRLARRAPTAVVVASTLIESATAPWLKNAGRALGPVARVLNDLGPNGIRTVP